MERPPPLPRRLPVLATFVRSFSLAWQHRDRLVAAYLAYAALTILLDLAVTRFQDQLGGWLPLGLDIVQLLVWLGLATGLSRLILMGEARSGLRLFCFGKPFLRYGGAAIAVLAGTLALLFAEIQAVATIGQDPRIVDLGSGGVLSPRLLAGFQLVAMTLGIAGMIALIRLSLAMPAAALDETLRLGALWKASRGNGFRLFAVAFFVIFPFIIIEFQLLAPTIAAAMEVAKAAGNGAGNAVVPAVTPPLSIIIAWDLVAPFALIASTVMTALCYDFLMRGRSGFGPPAER